MKQLFTMPYSCPAGLQTINSLEKDISGLKKEIGERDETIGDKEKRIYDLKKKNQVQHAYIHLCSHPFHSKIITYPNTSICVRHNKII